MISEAGRLTEVRHLARQIRFGFLISWILSGILFGYFVIWLAGFNEARYQRASSGLKQACLILGNQLADTKVPGSTATPALEDSATPPYLLRFYPACSVAALDRWAAAPCDSAESYPLARPYDCTEFKDHVALLLKEYKVSLGQHFINEDIAVPAFSSRLSVVDFILLAPIFLLSIFVWNGLNLRNLRTLVIEHFSVQKRPQDLVASLISESLLYSTSRGGLTQFLFQLVTCYAPAIAMVALISSDLYDLAYSFAVFTPMSDQPVWSWVRDFSSGLYCQKIAAREGILLLLTFGLGLAGSSFLTISSSIRNLLAFQVLRPGLEVHSTLVMRQVLKDTSRTGWEVSFVNVELVFDPPGSRRRFQTRQWRLDHRLILETPKDDRRVVEKSTWFPALWAIPWESPINPDVVAHEVDRNNPAYSDHLYEEFMVDFPDDDLAPHGPAPKAT